MLSLSSTQTTSPSYMPVISTPVTNRTTMPKNKAGKILKHATDTQGLVLGNEPFVPTFIQTTGSSTIDLFVATPGFLTNVWRGDSVGKEHLAMLCTQNYVVILSLSPPPPRKKFGT